MITPLTYTTIELYHDIKTLTWSIKREEDGMYIHINQRLVDTLTLEELQYAYKETYGEKFPLAVFDAMKKYANNTHPYIHVPIIDDLPLRYIMQNDE